MPPCHFHARLEDRLALRWEGVDLPGLRSAQGRGVRAPGVAEDDALRRVEGLPRKTPASRHGGWDRPPSCPSSSAPHARRSVAYLHHPA